jgi:hypothetical protein
MVFRQDALGKETIQTIWEGSKMEWSMTGMRTKGKCLIMVSWGDRYEWWMIESIDAWAGFSFFRSIPIFN